MRRLGSLSGLGNRLSRGVPCASGRRNYISGNYRTRAWAFLIGVPALKDAHVNNAAVTWSEARGDPAMGNAAFSTTTSASTLGTE